MPDQCVFNIAYRWGTVDEVDEEQLTHLVPLAHWLDKRCDDSCEIFKTEDLVLSFREIVVEFD